MKYVKLEIEGLRRIKKANFIFSEATFFIGENNVGKSIEF